MVLLRFEEQWLRGELDRLPRTHRAAFAAACAERLFPAYVRFSEEARTGDVETLRGALSRLWQDLAGDALSELEIHGAARRCLALVPPEEPWLESQPSAEDAAASVVYALQSRVNEGSQEALWSARRAYDALDSLVRGDRPAVPVTASPDQRALEHELVQAELARQARDLQELLDAQDRDVAPIAARLRERANREARDFFGELLQGAASRKGEVNELQVQVVELARAVEACERILGCRPTALTPDAIASTVKRVEWKPLPGWESKSDSEIAIRAGLFAIGLSGPLLVATEAGFAKKRGAFVVDARDLGALVSQHLERCGESFFNGDAIVVEREGARIWLFHHEGQYATILAA
jgi:uncharacterized protein YjaG (DUF416 family)